MQISLNGLFLQACRANDEEKIMKLLNHPEASFINVEKSGGLSWLCYHANQKVIDYIMRCPTLDSCHDDLLKTLARESSHERGLPVIRYMVRDEFLKGHTSEDARQDALQLALNTSCANHHMDIIRYILTDEEIVSHSLKVPDLSHNSHYVIKVACMQNHPEVVKLLLQHSKKTTPKDYPKHVKLALEYAHTQHAWDVMQYMVFDLNVKRTRGIDKLIEDKPDLTTLFERRSLRQELDTKLQASRVSPRKIKL